MLRFGVALATTLACVSAATAAYAEEETCSKATLMVATNDPAEGVGPIDPPSKHDQVEGIILGYTLGGALLIGGALSIGASLSLYPEGQREDEDGFTLLMGLGVVGTITGAMVTGVAIGFTAEAANPSPPPITAAVVPVKEGAVLTVGGSF
jgi:hypothetical protein